MKRLDVSQVVDPYIRQPFSGPENLYMQNAYQEVFSAVASPMIPNQNNITILSGVSATTITSGATFTSGWVWYNNEAFYVPATTVYTGIGQTYIGIMQTVDPIGPVLFSDNIQRIVYNQRQIVLSAGTSGSGIADFNNWDSLTDTNWQYALLSSGNTTAVGGTINSNVAGFIAWRKFGKNCHIMGQVDFKVTNTTCIGVWVNLQTLGIGTMNNTQTINYNSFGTPTVGYLPSVGFAWDLNPTTSTQTTFVVQGNGSYTNSTTSLLIRSLLGSPGYLANNEQYQVAFQTMVILD